MQLTPLRKPTLKKKISQLKDTGVVFLVGTDSGIPTKFHCQSTWNEMAIWVEQMEISDEDKTELKEKVYPPLDNTIDLYISARLFKLVA